MKKFIAGSCLVLALNLPALVSAASFDFQNWIAVNGEQGFNNSSPFSLTDMGLTLTATAFESSPDGTPSHVYMDGSFNGIIGGMGVCTNLTEGNQCNPSSDDNVSIDAATEILSWNFDQNITQIVLELGNDGHNDFNNGSFNYSLDNGTSWSTATTNGSATATLVLGGSNQVDFKAAGNTIDDHFYIRNANVTVVPVPAAVWLFGSGLLGLVGIARSKAA
jgi:hypothetical protein